MIISTLTIIHIIIVSLTSNFVGALCTTVAKKNNVCELSTPKSSTSQVGINTIYLD